MVLTVASWFGLVSVILIGLFGFGLYLTLLTFIVSFLIGILTILYFNYDHKKVFSIDLDYLDDPLRQSNFSVQIPKLLELFKKEPHLAKFDNRITGSETVDSFLNEIVTIIINDYVTPWYEILTTDTELTEHSIRKVVLAGGVNIANRVKCVDWVHILTTRFPEELTSHLKLFKQSKIRLKHIDLTSAKDVANGNGKPSPKKQDDRKTHKRNKSDTELAWPPDSSTYGKSKFYSDSGEHGTEKSLVDLFFDLECAVENKRMCRDVFCLDPDKEYALLSEVSQAVLYLVAPEEAWNCHALKLLLTELLSAVVLKPLVNLLSDPDNINRAIIRMFCKDISLSSELFLMVIRCSSDAEELDATLDMVQKDIQKLHSKDSAGEWEIQDRQKLSSLQYLSRIVQARRATLGPREGSSNNSNPEKVTEEVKRSLKFLTEVTAWKSNAQYCLEIELNENDSAQTSKAVLDSLRSTALELCDMYLATNSPPMIGLPANCHADLVRKITTDGEQFTSNPQACFDDLAKAIYDALEDDPSWQADYMLDEQAEAERMNDYRKEEKFETKKYSGDTLSTPGMARHSRSRSDIVGSQKMINETSGGSSGLSSANTSSLSLSHSEINSKYTSPLSASIIETALVQSKGKTFGIYAIAVTRLSDKEIWHIYRRYSDFYDLHCSIKDRWPELNQLSFPGKKTFQNTSRSVLESRKRTLNHYLQSLATLARETRYTGLWAPAYLGGFLSPENQAEKHSNSIDAVLVNSIRAGMRTLKNMPDQFANTVDGVMDGISKVFQGKSGDSYYDGLKSGNSSDGPDEGDESACFRLLEEVLGLRGLWLRRRLLAPVRTLIADRVNKKVLELVSFLTSPRSVVQYLKTFKQWLQSRDQLNYAVRDDATKARTRVVAKVTLLTACSDDLRHIVGSDTARRGLLNVFDLFQSQEINRRIIFVFLECILLNLFPDNNIEDIFRRLYADSPRVPPKKVVNI
ncbi:unnamed protein product [Plutella xylostella]|uniref:(diamondback moth) hypothetical protein n=1 Tax=Plutella xylostella TaxID=51655 RepID=A0A8S4DBH4_PLUXY|nr:unnamed protein product [Plutella xylostella]